MLKHRFFAVQNTNKMVAQTAHNAPVGAAAAPAIRSRSFSLIAFASVLVAASTKVAGASVGSDSVLSRERALHEVAPLHVATAAECAAYGDCLSCTNTTRFAENTGCRWCLNSCRDPLSANLVCHSAVDAIVRYDDMCRVVPEAPTPYLANWMGQNMAVIGSLTLLDVSLPGTHDTLTYDLSTRVSDGGIDGSSELAQILHDYAAIVPDGIEDFIRQQAETHDLTISQQLQNGIRFFDFRIMYEYSDKVDPDWYSLHCVQSNNKAMKYFTEINDFLNVHKEEVVVLWLSKHGSECAVGADAYPNVTVSVKQAYWNSIVSLFSDKIVDFTTTPINSTSLQTMVDSNKRVVIYASDYKEFTGSSKYALDGCLIDNRLPPGLDDLASAAAYQRDVYSSAQSVIDAGKSGSKFLLMSLASGGGGSVPIMFALRFFKTELPGEEAKCAAKYSVPGMSWCPPTLLDQSQLHNYYSQQGLEDTVTVAGYRLPNAIYVNGVDWDGTIRTGTQVLWGAVRNFYDNEHQATAYAYVDTFILNNLMVACGGDSGVDGYEIHSAKDAEKSVACAKGKEFVEARRSKHPIEFWDDAAFGRLSGFPAQAVGTGK
jgi:hypothetical protein